MESLGDKIKNAREDKGYSLDQVARDTHISKRFLEAIESENFAILPGESYVVGFLRSYSEFLGLNSSEVIQLFRNMKIQEEPAPIEALLEKRGISLPIKIALGFGGLGVVIFALVLVFSGSGVPENGTAQKPVPEPVINDREMVVFDGKVLERSFVSGQKIQFPLGTVSPEATIKYEGDKVVLVISGEPLALETGKVASIDLSGDKQPDVRFLVRSVDSRNVPAKIVMRLDREVASVSIPDSAETATEVSDPNAAIIPNPAAGLSSLPAPVGMTSITSRQKVAQTLLESPQVGPIAATISFSSVAYFRIQSDLGRREERFSISGEKLALNGAAYCRIWLSNASRAKLIVNGKEFNLGISGEVVAWQLAWVPNPAGGQILQLQAMY